MAKVAVRTSRAPRPVGRYSQAICFQQLVFTSGIAGTDPMSGQLVEGGIRAQVRQTLENVKAVLEEAHTSLDCVVKVNAYLCDIGDFQDYNAVYAEYFGSDPPPARTTVQVGALPGRALVEIDAIAYVPE